MFIQATTEQAFLHRILSSSLSASAIPFNVFLGLGNETKDGPCLTIVADSAREEFPGLGVWHVNTLFSVKEMAADTNATSSLAKDIFSVILSSATKPVLSAFPNYHCHDLFVEDSPVTQQGDAWAQSVRMDVVCALI